MARKTVKHWTWGETVAGANRPTDNGRGLQLPPSYYVALGERIQQAQQRAR